MKRQNTDQNDDDRAERHYKVDEFHGVVSLSLGFFILSASGWPDRKRKDHEKRGSAETGEASGAASFLRVSNAHANCGMD